MLYRPMCLGTDLNRNDESPNKGDKVQSVPVPLDQVPDVSGNAVL